MSLEESFPINISGDYITSNFVVQSNDSSIVETIFVGAESSGGIIALPSSTSIGNVTATELGHLSGVTSSLQIQIDNILSRLNNAGL